MFNKIKEKLARYYLTYYEEYPIYESAEGGYYYAGYESYAYYRFFTKWGAKRKLAKMKPELEADGWIVNKCSAHLSSKYVGDGKHIYIEKKLGSHESGRQVYQ
jgi:hypothetical protein